jgi:murein DD-endopeptidase MepM/ murein hydrolase activator NlpD
MSTRSLLSFFLGIVTVFVVQNGTYFAYAQSEVAKLQAQIEEKNNRLSSIEKEIAQYESALQEVGAEKDTLQRAINQLELERKKVNADISYTENKIASTDLEIDKLILEIDKTKENIASNEEVIREILRTMHISDEESLLEVFLRQENISEFWNAFENLETIKTSVGERVDDLTALKMTLEKKRDENTDKKNELLDLKDQYSDQHSILESNKAEKSTLLTKTKNEESNYQTLLKEKESAREKLLAEVRDIESQIQFILDPNTIPVAGTAVFRWPLENPYITQYFGYTKFALSGAYNGSAHNGVDLGTPVGTKIRAPLTGTVRMTGNTDLVPGCYSWGKWILIDHPNGLSTLFAHLSQISVTPGQKVNTGDIVAYSGNTGYSTGPHLHYTLYVTEGVQVKRFNEFKAATGCGAALSPFAAVEAYLDPLDYLPPI